MDEFEEHGLEDASASSAAAARSVKTAAAAAPAVAASAPGSGVLQMRTYDLSITYDNTCTETCTEGDRYDTNVLGCKCVQSAKWEV